MGGQPNSFNLDNEVLVGGCVDLVPMYSYTPEA